MKKTSQFHLEKLSEITEKISPIQSAYFSEAAIIALKNQGHDSGKLLNVKGDFDKQYSLAWDSSPSNSGWQEKRIIAENASIAIAFFLILELTEFKILRQSVIGTGFDYWMSYDKNHSAYDPDNFLNGGLEVSGIIQASEAIVKKRVKQKIRQTDPSDDLNIPIFVIVTEFGAPLSYIVQK